MSRFNSSYGFLLFPFSDGGFAETYNITETAGKLCKIGLAFLKMHPVSLRSCRKWRQKKMSFVKVLDYNIDWYLFAKS